MDGVLENPDTEEPHEMGDPDKKEMTDEEMEQFDEARSSAMGTFSEVKLFFNLNSSCVFYQQITIFLKKINRYIHLKKNNHNVKV